jgi:hypothetical protein
MKISEVYKEYVVHYDDETKVFSAKENGLTVTQGFAPNLEKGFELAKAHIDKLEIAQCALAFLSYLDPYLPDTELESKALQMLEYIALWDDTEGAHVSADQVLVELLNVLGYEKVTEA